MTQRSGAVAAILSTIFPGLGQMYLRRRREALILALPVLALMAGLIWLVLVDGMTRTGARLLSPTIALGVALLVLVLGMWWITGIATAWRAGRHGGGSAVILPLVLVALIVTGTLYGADWMYRLSLADRSFGAGPDPTLADTPAPSPTQSITNPPPTVSPLSSSTPSVTPTATTPAETPEPTDPPATIEPGPSPSFDITKLDAQNDGWLNVLLLGLDTRCAGGLVTGANTDTMIVVSAEAATGAVYMFSFPRDLSHFPLYVGGTYGGESNYPKLNTFAGFTKQRPDLFSEPGQPALAYQLGYLLGIPIDYYASINVCGFPQLIDEVGGVTVCNTKTIDDSGYHWTDGRVGFHLDPGSYHFDGLTALAYARSRHGSSDFARARRQQQLLGAIRQAILAPQNIARLPEIVSSIGGIVHTNFPPDGIDQLLALASQVQDDPSGQYVLQPPTWASHPPASQTSGRSVQFLKLDAVAALSLQVFGDKSLYAIGGVVPSASPLDLPTPSPEPSDGPSPC